MRRKRTITAVAIVVVLTGAALALLRGFDINRYREPLQAAVAARVQRDVSLGAMHLSLVPLGLRVEDAAIADDPAFQTKAPFVRAEELYVSPRLFPLLRGRFELRSVELRRPVIELLRNPAGTWNFSTLGRRETTGRALVLHRVVVTDGRVAVTGADGRMVYDDIDLRLEDYAPGRRSAKGSLRLDQASARGVSLGYPITADFDVTYDSAALLTVRKGIFRLDKTPLSFTGTVNLAPDVPEVNAHITASDVSLAEAARLVSAFGLVFGDNTQVEGRMNADVQVRGPVRRPALDGRMDVRNLTISGAGFARPVRTEGVNLVLSPTQIRSNDFTASTNSTSLAVRFILSDYATPEPRVDTSVRTIGADLGDTLNVARAWGIRAASGMSGSGRLTLNVRATGPIRTLTYTGSGTINDATLQAPPMTQPLRVRTATITFSGDGAVIERLAASLGRTRAEGRLAVRRFADPHVDFQLSADRIDVPEMQALFAPATRAQQPDQRRGERNVLLRTTGSGRLRAGIVTSGTLVLENLETTATLDRGLIRLDPLTAGLFGGRHRGAVVVDARRTPAAYTVASDLEQVDANRLASAVTNVRDVIYGALASVVRVSFSTDSEGKMARSMNGTLSLSIPDGRIAKMDVIHEVAAIARFVSDAPADTRSTRVTALRGHFAVSNGVARTDDLTATLEEGVLQASGWINLVDQGLNLRVMTVLSGDFSRSVGGTRVGGFLSTALANRKGELVVPMLVTGTLQQPRFTPDVQRVAEMKFRNLVPSLLDPQRFMDEIVGTTGKAPEPPEPDTQQPAQKATPARQLEDALRKLLGGSRDDPQQRK
jgi:uncharacterized protein involved in outer membrane biogenesis